MPYRRSARFTVTNEGKQEVGSFYSNIDYMTVPSLPDDALYFHAQYRQNAPCVPVTYQGAKLNPDGEKNYVYMETRGRGHLMGVTLGRAAERERLVGRRRRHDLRRRRVEARDRRHRVGGLLPGKLEFRRPRRRAFRSRTRCTARR